jgi:uncharacterized protein (TIGR02268 family)
MERSFRGFLYVLSCLLALLPQVGVAQDAPAHQRSVYLSNSPKDEVPEVFVAAQNVTTLRFERPCDPGQTKLLGWEARFEPLLVGGKSVVLVPVRKLDPDDRFMLLVTFMDGTSLPFTVRAGEHGGDGQVNVFAEPESPAAIRSRLEEMQEENRSLHAKVQRYHEEETSVNHALAALLAANRVELTPFKLWRKWRFNENGIKAEVVIFDDDELKRVAVVFTLQNLDEQKPWSLQEASLTSLLTSEEKPFALRMSPAFISPGKTGRIAIVTDADSLFSNKGKDQIVLEIFRDGGLRQAFVYMEPASRHRR